MKQWVIRYSVALVLQPSTSQRDAQDRLRQELEILNSSPTDDVRVESASLHRESVDEDYRW